MYTHIYINYFQLIKETGFLKGLFTEEELNSDNIKDKEAKLAFLTKLIDVVSEFFAIHWIIMFYN